MAASHLFHLDSTPPQRTMQGGSRTDAFQTNFPVLQGMAISLLRLDVKGMREPHWHPNANELSYCVEGKALMTIFNPGAGHSTFTIEPGVLSFVPMGSLHHIQNIGNTPLKLLVCFDNSNPEDLELSSSIAVMPKHILAETFKLSSNFFEGLHAAVKPIFITDNPLKPHIEDAWETSPFKFNVEAEEPQINNAGGAVRMSNSFLMSSLNGLSLYGVSLNKQGAREPHWHPNAHELNYLISGNARITLLSPGGNVDTFDLKAGDMSFLPKGYLHHIENTGNDPARFAIFFNNTAPSDIGLSGCLGAYSNEVLAALFKVPVDYFKNLPKYQSDLFVVSGGG